MRIVLPEEVRVYQALRLNDGKLVDETKNIKYLREHSVWVNLDEGVLIVHGYTSPYDRYSGNDKPFLVAWASPGISTRKRNRLAAEIIGGDSTATLPITSDFRGNFTRGGRPRAALPALAWAESLSSDDLEPKSELKGVVSFWEAIKNSSMRYTCSTSSDEISTFGLDPYTLTRACSNILRSLRHTVTNIDYLRDCVEFKNQYVEDYARFDGSIWSVSAGASSVGNSEVEPILNFRDSSPGNLRVTNIPECRNIGLRYLELLSNWQYDVHWSILRKNTEAFSENIEWDKSVTGRKGYRTKRNREGRKQVEAFRGLSLSRYVEITRFQVARAALFISRLVPGYDNSSEIKNCFSLCGVPIPEGYFTSKNDPERDLEFISEVARETGRSGVSSTTKRIIEGLRQQASEGSFADALKNVIDHIYNAEERAKEDLWRHRIKESSTSDRSFPQAVHSAYRNGKLEDLIAGDEEVLSKIAQYLSLQVEVDGCRRSAEILSENAFLMDRVSY